MLTKEQIETLRYARRKTKELIDEFFADDFTSETGNVFRKELDAFDAAIDLQAENERLKNKIINVIDFCKRIQCKSINNCDPYDCTIIGVEQYVADDIMRILNEGSDEDE